jgi:2-polyprenyl-6-methoxyphenol hydroxylase-like FAD-dependent oxidoreductase
VVLAKSLRDMPDIPRALDAYERQRRRRVERIVAQGARTSSAKTAGPQVATIASSIPASDAKANSND